MKNNEEIKITHGQFYTVKNPFDSILFKEWLENYAKCDKRITFLEPFAGSGNIPNMIKALGFDNKWQCYDLYPNNNANIKVTKKDTLKKYPEGYKIVITNPPYLAKNSSTRKDVEFPEEAKGDLYLHALYIMLKHSEFIACIIPLSFMQKNLFHDRLIAIDIITYSLFEDTECPVCVAYFVPEDVKKHIHGYGSKLFRQSHQKLTKLSVENATSVINNFEDWKNNFQIWENGKFYKTYYKCQDALDGLKIGGSSIRWVFNDPAGNITLMGGG